MRDRFGHLMWDCGGLRLVGSMVLMLSFLLAFKDMELEHNVVIGTFCFRGRELINNF